ncbi:flavodoxin [Maridesulfovibrio sp.]|uniref:flavodoxin n=1 Tax=unclassified Maridesulfovibrio TaxID=2794999 RepID=UPI003AFFB95A
MKKHISRRAFIKLGILGGTSSAITAMSLSGRNVPACNAAMKPDNNMVLTAFFSHTGNTRYMAEQINGRVGGDLLEIKTIKPYLGNDRQVHITAKNEKRRNFRPKLSTAMPDTSKYNVFFIGYPCWWHTMPMTMFSFFDQLDLSGKTIIPFTTHGGSKWGTGLSDLKAINPQSDLKEGLALYGRSVKKSSSVNEIKNWLSSSGF